MIKVVINQERCKSCGLCIAHCPKRNLKPSEALNKAGHHFTTLCDDTVCTGCGVCALMCPDVCLAIYRCEETADQP